jgi:hypothetical protein
LEVTVTRRTLGQHDRALLLLCALLAPASLASCGSSSGGPAAQADTTVLVYILGTDLESGGGNATINLDEMMKVGSTATMNVVIQTGGAKKAGTPPTDKINMQPANIDWTRVQRYVVKSGSLQQVGDLGPESGTSPAPAFNMGNATTLEDFLRWGVETYKAKKYVVVLWDHGGGVNGGFGPDEITNPPRPETGPLPPQLGVIKVSGISHALSKVSTDLNVKFEIAGFDACLMATGEVAASLASSSRYMVASQDIEPGSGWDYTPFLKYVSDNPNVSGEDIGREIARTYVAKQLASNNASVTLSVTDLSKVTALVEATDAFATALGPYAARQDGWKQIAQARVRSLDWYTAPLLKLADDLVDMHTFVFKVVDFINKSIAPDDALTGAGLALGNAIEAAVVHNVATGSNVAATGLTLYFPASVSAYPAKNYPANTTVDDLPYFARVYTNATNGLVKSYYDYYLANTAALHATVTMDRSPANSLAATINNDFDNVIAANQSASCKLYGPNGEITPAPPCFHAMQAVQGATQIPGGKWQVTFSNTAGWLHLTDGAGNSFPVAMIPDQLAGYKIGDFNEYLVPVYRITANTGSFGYLIVEEVFPLVPGPRTYKVTGFQLGGDIPGKFAPLANGEVYGMAAYVGTPLTGYSFFMTDREVTVSGGTLTMSAKAISGGQFGYLVTDLTGTLQSSDVLVPYPTVP